MSLFEQWQGAAYVERSQQEYDAFWSEYLAAEQKNYESILENKDEKIEGTLKELADRFGMDAVTFTGFLDGINTSLVTALDLDSLTEESQITLDIDLEKLFYNMLDAKAEWLYNLPQWDAILTVEKRKEIKKSFNATKTVVKDKKVGRNEPCPCGSGKKYKKCCINK